MNNWQQIKFEDSLEESPVSRKYQIKSSEIKQNGAFPVVDQSKQLIAGYTDDSHKVIFHDTPHIIFGDHTRIFKFIDFPYVIGADGTKTLVPKVELFDPEYFYFYLLSLSISSRGYNRHYSLLKENIVKRPPKNIQVKMSRILSVIQDAIHAQDETIQNILKLKNTLLNFMFDESLTEATCPFVYLEELIERMDYGTSVKCDLKKKDFAVLRIPNVINGVINLDEIKYGLPKANEVDNLKLEDGDILFVRTNGQKDYVGRSAVFKSELKECYFASYIIRIRLKKNVIPEFINYYTQTKRGKSYLSGKSIRTADGKFNINTGTLKNVYVPLPELNKQIQISQSIKAIEDKLMITQKKRASLEELFQSLLHRLMNEEIDVENINLN